MSTNRLLKASMLLFFCVLFAQTSFSQTKTITGKITDDQGKPLSVVTIKIKGTKFGTTSDEKGMFKISVPTGSTILEISRVGYTSQDIDISNKDNIDVSLVSNASSLNDVVVIGYGTARRKDVTGAVSQLNSKDFTTGNLSSPLQAIQGKVPGLTITVPGGDPNGLPIVQLRGQASLAGGSTPLFVVDNVPLDDPSQMANIPSVDIVTYDVLKDASATAIYGSRGANGVILITTRRGHAGDPEISYSGSVSIDNMARKLPLANTAEANQAYGMINVTPPSSTYNTDWQNAMTQTGVSTNHSITLLGGGKGFSYRGTAFYNDMQGIVINTGKNAQGLNITLQQKALNNKLDVQANATYTVTNRKLTNYNVFYGMIASPTQVPVYSSPGVFSPDNALYANVNPVWMQTQETNVGKEVLGIISGSVDYNIIKDLKLGVWGSIFNFTNQVGFYQPIFGSVFTNPTAAVGTENRWSYKGNAHAYYNKSWDKNNLSLSGVYEYNDYWYNNNAGLGQGYINDQNTFNNLGGGVQQYDLIYSTKNRYKLISFLGRLAYNYDYKYYITASVRRDGSSKFGANNAWGTFPSISAAWRISQEGFMQNVSWLNELKLNVGYGVVGNQDAIGVYQSRLLYSQTGNFYNAETNQYLAAYGATQNANPNLQWEQVGGANIGLDYVVLSHRLTGSINYFNNKTTKLLGNYNVPFPAPGFVVNSILANVGTLTNKGFEFQLNYDLVRKSVFSWTIGGNISTVKTRITSLSGNYNNGLKTYSISTNNVIQGSAEGQGLSTAPLTYFIVGQTPNVFNIPHFTGFNSSRVQTFDAGGDTTTTNPLNAVNHIYDPSPKFNYAITNSFRYREWSLSIFLRGVAGQKIYNNTRMIMSRLNYVNGANILKEAIADNDMTSSPEVSDRFLEKAGYLRLENLTLSRSFKVHGIQKLNLYLSANNLFVITKYVGFDPELRNTQTGTPFLQGYTNNVSALNINNQRLIATSPQPNMAYIDAVYSGSGDGYYPKSRSFTIGINITLK